MLFLALNSHAILMPNGIKDHTKTIYSQSFLTKQTRALRQWRFIYCSLSKEKVNVFVLTSYLLQISVLIVTCHSLIVSSNESTIHSVDSNYEEQIVVWNKSIFGIWYIYLLKSLLLDLHTL